MALLSGVAGVTELPLNAELWFSRGRGDCDDCYDVRWTREWFNTVGIHGTSLLSDLQPWAAREEISAIMTDGI